MPTLKNKYQDGLKSLYPANCSLREPSKYPGEQTEQAIQKYCTSILTESFWLSFNFFYFGYLSYDPLLADIARGPIPTCILATNEEGKDTLDVKKLLLAEEQQGGLGRGSSSRASTSRE